LSLDSGLVEFAHEYSKKSNKPISKIFGDYLAEMNEQYTTGLPKDLEELYGIFEGLPAPDKKELRRMFHEKDSN
jgi:hypothetical protein